MLEWHSVLLETSSVLNDRLCLVLRSQPIESVSLGQKLLFKTVSVRPLWKSGSTFKENYQFTYTTSLRKMSPSGSLQSRHDKVANDDRVRDDKETYFPLFCLTKVPADVCDR